MIIEIKGPGSHNKGAEMMLLVILQQLRRKDAKFTIAAQRGICEYPFYSRLGVYPKFWHRFHGIEAGRIGKYLPKKLRDIYGLVIDEEVDIVLDASGFAYSSQWGTLPTKVMAERTIRWRRSGKKVILLPQSFGPFHSPRIKRYMSQIIENANLIFARDEYSFHELKKIGDGTERIKRSPDFTILLDSTPPSDANKDRRQVCIVPNQRMKDRALAEQYEAFFADSIRVFLSENLSPFFLLFGGEEDRLLSNRINALLDRKLEVVDESNPCVIKSIIRNSLGLFGSRFHALASAFYSGTPAIGTGWSHKYRHLYEEFGFPEGLLDIRDRSISLREQLSPIIDKKKRARLSQQVERTNAKYRSEALSMFDLVRREIGFQ